MRKFLGQDGPRRDANPSPEQMEETTKTAHELNIDATNEGSEFLDDSLRMKEQAFSDGDPDEDE